MTEAEVQKRLEEREDKQFAAAEFALRQAIQDVPVLKNLADNLIIDRTPEGLCIQIVDQEKRSMIPLRSAQIADNAQKLTGLVAQVVQKLPNKVSITGYTDAAPYAFGRDYTNWELSADRANASRRNVCPTPPANPAGCARPRPRAARRYGGRAAAGRRRCLPTSRRG